MVDFLTEQIETRERVDFNVATSFTFSAHSDELVIGGVFVKIYNDQPAFQITVSTFVFLLFGVYNDALQEAM